MNNTSREIPTSFPDEILQNQSAETVPVDTAELNNGNSSIEVRLRGCFITDCELTDPESGEAVKILHSDPDISVAKLTASHIMSPVGKTDDIGGQHGFARWADYHEFALPDANDGKKRASFQAKRSDSGLGIYKIFELGNNTLFTETFAQNDESEPTATSLGEHLYFSLEEENFSGIKINGLTIDEMLGDNSEAEILGGKSMLLPSYDGDVTVELPDGHKVKISSKSSSDLINMIVWHRKGSKSICFEPTAGFSIETGNKGLDIPALSSASLSTMIELLPKSAN